MTRSRGRALLGLLGLVGVLCPALLGATATPGAAAQTGPCALTGVAAGPVDYTRSLPLGQGLKAVYLSVDYSDAPSTADEAAARQQTLLDGVPERLSALTAGVLGVTITAVPKVFRLPLPSSTYGNGTTSNDRHFRDVLAAADADVDFSQYDLVYFAAPEGADPGINSQALSRRQGTGSTADGKELRAWVVFGPVLSRNVTEHETLHLFGLTDLYGATADTLNSYVGSFDVMGKRRLVPELLAWHRWKIGTIPDERFVCLPLDAERELTLAPLTSTSGGPVGFGVRTSQNTVLVGEYRTAAGLDTGLCRSGLLLYEADDRNGDEGPLRVVDSRPTTTPTCSRGSVLPLDDAPFDLQQPVHTDPAGVQVQVLGMDANGLRVRIGAPREVAAPAPGVTLSPARISAGQVVTASWTGQPGQVVEVMSRTQPATEFGVIRTITLDSAGRATTTHKPQRNTRLTGRTAGTTATGSAPLIEVRSVASMNVFAAEDGGQEVTGRVYPARDRRIVNLYRDDRLVAQTRCDAQGVYVFRTRLTGAAELQTRTGDDTYNLGARSTAQAFDL